MGFKLAVIWLLLGSPAFAAGVANVENDGGDGGAHEVCAMSFREFDSTKRLQELKVHYPANTVSGYVNQTHGSYYEIDSRGEWLQITFYTSGLFDLYLIKRTSPVVICDDGDKLTVKGLDREDVLKIENGNLIMGKGGPRQTFTRGPMPELLKTLSVEKP